MARRTYDISDDQHVKLKRLAGLFGITQSKLVGYLIDRNWDRFSNDYPKLKENHEKAD